MNDHQSQDRQVSIVRDSTSEHDAALLTASMMSINDTQPAQVQDIAHLDTGKWYHLFLGLSSSAFSLF
jgi:uncharacterized membrane-anchored protein